MPITFSKCIYVCINIICAFHILINTCTASDFVELPELSADDIRTTTLYSTFIQPHVDAVTESRTTLNEIFSGLKDLRFDTNVHDIDTLVNAYQDKLLTIGRIFECGRDIPYTESLEIARATARDSGTTSDANIMRLCDGFSPADYELFSRFVTFTDDLNTHHNYDIGISHYVTIDDNWTTNGGCLAGRRDRLFIAYATMIAATGIMAEQQSCSTQMF